MGTRWCAVRRSICYIARSVVNLVQVATHCLRSKRCIADLGIPAHIISHLLRHDHATPFATQVSSIVTVSFPGPAACSQSARRQTPNVKRVRQRRVNPSQLWARVRILSFWVATPQGSLPTSRGLLRWRGMRALPPLPDSKTPAKKRENLNILRRCTQTHTPVPGVST